MFSIRSILHTKQPSTILKQQLKKFTTSPPTSKFNPLVYAPSYKRDKATLFRVGNRETVGYGWNGEPHYADQTSYPFPSIRYKEPSQEMLALKEIEKGDWKLLSKNDKKSLYRYSFCQTFVEFKTGRPAEFFEISGYGLMGISVALWLYVFVQIYAYPELPDSFTPASKRAQMRRQLNLMVNPIEGLSSNWDYEKMDWKKKGWFTPMNPFVVCPDDLDDDDGKEDEDD